jgi:CDGSH-type Zn-finger protein
MPDHTVRITPTENGPLLVEGPIVVQQPDGTVIRETEKAFLCRCGFSEKKPFCDGSHAKKNWKA